MYPTTLFLAGLVLPFVNAFSDSHPVIAWSSLSSRSLSRVSEDTPTFVSGNNVIDNLLDVEELCNHDLVVIISKQGLHANHLRDTNSNKRIASLLEQSPSSFQLPHVTSLSQKTFEDLASQVSSRCGHRVVKDTLESKPPSLKKGSKHVLCMEGKHGHQDTTIMDHIGSLTKHHSSHLIILAGIPIPSPSHSHSRRQRTPLQQPSNTSIPSTEGGIFSRYQLFTPTLVTALLIFILVWVPIVFVGLNALSSIQVPRIGSIGKSVSAEKKNQ